MNFSRIKKWNQSPSYKKFLSHFIQKDKVAKERHLEPNLPQFG